MKKLLSISLVVLVSAVALAFTTPKATNVVENSKSVETVLTAEEDALYCSVTIGTRSATCWFCDCDKLAKTLIANQ